MIINFKWVFIVAQELYYSSQGPLRSTDPTLLDDLLMLSQFPFNP